MKTYHTLGDRDLWDWHSIDIETVDNTKYVYMNSRIHMNERVLLSPQFSTKFTDHQILNDRDLMTDVIQRYGVSCMR